MADLATIAFQASQPIALLVLAPAIEGVRRTVEGRLRGVRTGGIVAPYRELFALRKRRPSLPGESSPLTKGAPHLSLAAALFATALVPLWFAPALGREVMDGLSLLGLWLAAWALPSLSALDADEPSETAPGLAFAAALVPAVALLFFAAFFSGGSTELGAAIRKANDPEALWLSLVTPARLSSLVALAALAFAAPGTDHAPYNGRHLAQLRYADHLRRAGTYALLGAVLLPGGLWSTGEVADWGFSAGVGLLKLVLLAAAHGALSARARRAPVFYRMRFAALGLGAALLAAFTAAQG